MHRHRRAPSRHLSCSAPRSPFSTATITPSSPFNSILYTLAVPYMPNRKSHHNRAIVDQRMKNTTASVATWCTVLLEVQHTNKRTVPRTVPALLFVSIRCPCTLLLHRAWGLPVSWSAENTPGLACIHVESTGSCYPACPNMTARPSHQQQNQTKYSYSGKQH